MRCIGYGPYEGKCTNKAGTHRTPYWCPRCDDLRVETIMRNLKDIMKKFEEKARKLMENAREQSSGRTRDFGSRWVGSNPRTSTTGP